MLYFSYLLNAYAPEGDEPHQLSMKRVHGTVAVRSSCRRCGADADVAFLSLLDLKYMFKVLCTQRLTGAAARRGRSIQNFTYAVRDNAVLFQMRSVTLRHCLLSGDLTLVDRRRRSVYLGSVNSVGLCALSLLLRVLYGQYHETVTLSFSHHAYRNKTDHRFSLLVRKRDAAARVETQIFLRNLHPRLFESPPQRVPSSSAASAAAPLAVVSGQCH